MTTTTQRQCLVLVELNEVNFDVARKYVQSLDLKGFGAMFAAGVRTTTSEANYEQLEPWIQWVSAHSGLTAEQHGIFRLGDIVASRVPQMFEQIEAHGLTVGAVSPMNAENRLAHPAYFLPDPWTQTRSDGSFWSRSLSQAISQAVNNNAEGKITLRSAVTLGLALVRFARARHYARYLRLAFRSRGAPWRKALFLDLLIHDVHWTLMHSRRPNFSTIFLNGGAHIQHHYYFNSKAIAQTGVRNPDWYISSTEDPIADMLQTYDAMLRDYLDDSNCDLIVATGLTQVPYNRAKYYYRPRDHADLLRALGVPFERVVPRMTRDFLIEFVTEDDATAAATQLAALTVSPDNLPLFGEIEHRGTSLFVTLTYPNEINDASQVLGAPRPIRLSRHVVFVAIKNGMHAPHGYLYCGRNVERFAGEDGSHVSRLHSMVMRYFGIGAVPGER